MRTVAFFLTIVLLVTDAALIGDVGFAEPPAQRYDPLSRQIEGWNVSLDPQMFTPENEQTSEQALTALANHLQRVKYILPKDRVEALQQLPIWVDWQHELSNMQYHPSRGWLLASGYDPRLVKHVHIPRARQLLDPKQWAKHPYAIMHELAHAYHDQVLGFDDPEILERFAAADESGSYEKVLLYSGGQVKHYALSNHKEYFAESTEAYLGVNDFYPFVRAELKQHDPKMYKLLEKIWGEIR